MNLRKNTFSATRWAAGSLLIRAVLQLAQTMILARLLIPADFGLVATVGAAYAIVVLFMDFGISNALIHFPQPSQSIRSTLYWLNIASAMLLALLFAALAWPYAHLYSEPALAPVMATMGLAMPLAAAGQQYRVLAEKELRFGRLALIETTAVLLGFMAAIATAVAGGGAYALVASVLVTATASSAMAWMFLSAGLRPTRHFNLPEAAAHLRYGAYRLGDMVANGVHSQLDVLIGGTVVGASAMGIYSVPKDLGLRLANTLVNPIVTRVGLPVMAKVQGDREALKSVYLQTLRMTASINFPLYLLLAVWAEEATLLLLGAQWQSAAAFLRLLAIWGFVRSTGNPVGSLLYATGQVRRAFWWNIALLLVVPAILWLSATHAGLHGLAIAMIAIQLLIFLPLHRFLVRPGTGILLGEYLGILLPPLCCALVAVAVSWMFSTAFDLHGVIALIAGAAVGSMAYLALSALLNRPWLSAMHELVTPLL